MIFYIAAIDDAMEGEVAYSPLKAAREARDEGTKVRKITTGRITRETACALFNREGFAVKQEEVE